MENRPGKGGVTTSSLMAKYAAEVAKKYIEKAYIEGYYALAEQPALQDGEVPAAFMLRQFWLKENGITEWGKTNT